MSQDCTICGYTGPGGPDLGHIEHAHAVALAGARLLAEQGERHKRTIAVFSGQKKNRMLLGMINQITRLQGELAQAQRALHQSTQDLRASIGLEDRP